VLHRRRFNGARKAIALVSSETQFSGRQAADRLLEWNGTTMVSTRYLPQAVSTNAWVLPIQVTGVAFRPPNIDSSQCCE
jgi:hypothetical protein